VPWSVADGSDDVVGFMAPVVLALGDMVEDISWFFSKTSDFQLLILSNIRGTGNIAAE